MKKILKTILVASVILIQTAYVKGQHTYQTAQRYNFTNTTWLTNDSTTTIQPGIGTGCALTNQQPNWVLLGACGTGNYNLNYQPLVLIGSSFNNTISIVIYGPFSDTLNLASKLTNVNIDTCYNSTSNAGFSIYLGNFIYHRGDIYMLLITSTNNVYAGGLSTSGPVFFQTDTAFCPLCNGRISELYQPVCTVTYDSASQKNKIIWSQDVFTPAQDYVIFRKNTAGTYDTLAFQSISQLSEYVDVTSSPLSKLYEYKMGIRDSCGQFIDKITNQFPSFTTMHLIAYPTGNNSAGLIWNPGSFNGPFYVYRTNPSGITTLIDSIGLVSGTQTYTDINAPSGLCSYQIGVNVSPACVASLLPTYTIVKSNPGFVTVTWINELSDLSAALKVQPNPFNKYTTIDLQHFEKQNLKVVLTNLTGQTVMQFDDVKTNELILERNNLSQGLYFLEVTGDGFYARKKLVVN